MGDEVFNVRFVDVYSVGNLGEKLGSTTHFGVHIYGQIILYPTEDELSRWTRCF